MFDAYLATLIEELESRGIARTALVHRQPAEITPEWFARTLEKAVQLTADPALSIAFGLRLNLASHGTLGYALMSSRNGDQLLTLLSRYAGLVMPNLSLKRVLAGTRLQLVCEAEELILPRRFLIELTLTTLVSGARALFNRRIPGAEVWLDFAPPAHAERYQALQLPVRFAQPHSALVCDRGFLTMSVASANPVMAIVGARQCEALLGDMQARTGIARQIRRALLLARGEFPDQQQIAGRLHISPRSLRRQLQREGVTYREIVDEVRFELARRFFEIPELRVADIAGLLGYDDPANFRRAFKRWSGTSPQQWQRQQAAS